MAQHYPAQGSQIILVSPHAHYAAHYWPDTLALMQALQRRGQSVRTVVFTNDTNLIPVGQRALVETVLRRLPSAWTRLAAGKWEYRRVVKLLFKCELFLCLFKALSLARSCANPVLHVISSSQWPVLLAVPLFPRIRFVSTLYGNLLPDRCQPTGSRRWSTKILENLLRRALATNRFELVCETEFVRDNLSELAGPFIHHIPAAINDEGFLPSQVEARQRLGLDPTGKILLFFGTHRREKDYLTALKGCLRLSNPPLALFVGKVISENDPHRVVAECAYPKAKIIDQFADEAAGRLYFAAADALVLPYEANYSKGSQVLIECCRSLRPMIATATPYFSAFITRYGCGLTFQAGDSISFGETAKRLLADTSVYRAGLERARHEHSWSVITDQYLRVYGNSIEPPLSSSKS
jgi:glycosyltransferase involved in cell wall biosynthesis